MTDDRSKTPSPPKGPPEAVQVPPVAANLRRPGDDIPNRPRLKVRARAAAVDVATPRPSVRRSAPEPAPQGDVPKPVNEADEPVSESEKAIREAKTLVVPPPSLEGGRYPFATHAPAPPDEEAEQAELDALAHRKPERMISTGFLLGIALIVVVLVGGMWIGRLGKKVAALENRVNRIEGQQVHTAALDLPAP